MLSHRSVWPHGGSRNSNGAGNPAVISGVNREECFRVLILWTRSTLNPFYDRRPLSPLPVEHCIGYVCLPWLIHHIQWPSSAPDSVARSPSTSLQRHLLSCYDAVRWRSLISLLYRSHFISGHMSYLGPPRIQTSLFSGRDLRQGFRPSERASAKVVPGVDSAEVIIVTVANQRISPLRCRLPDDLENTPNSSPPSPALSDIPGIGVHESGGLKRWTVTVPTRPKDLPR